MKKSILITSLVAVLGSAIPSSADAAPVVRYGPRAGIVVTTGPRVVAPVVRRPVVRVAARPVCRPCYVRPVCVPLITATARLIRACR